MIKHIIALFFLSFILLLPLSQASAQVCGDSQYNECIGCDISRRIFKHDCGTDGTAYETLVPSQSDSGCHDWCPVSSLEKADSQPGGIPTNSNCKRTYNECTFCNSSKTMEVDKCTPGKETYTKISTQDDPVCSSLCGPGAEEKKSSDTFSRDDFVKLCGPSGITSKDKTCDCTTRQVLIHFYCGSGAHYLDNTSETCEPTGSCQTNQKKTIGGGKIGFKEANGFTIQSIDPQPTVTHPTGSLILTGGQTNVAVGQTVEITAIGQAYQTRKLKEVGVLIARVPESGEGNLKFVRIDNCALGFNGQKEGNNSNWCWLLKGSTLTKNTIKWIPTKPGTYSMIMSAFDDKQDEISSFCSSNYANFPPNSTGYAETGPYINGIPTRYWKCDENNKDTLTLLVSSSSAGNNTAVPIGYHISNTKIAESVITPSVSVSTFPVTIDDYNLLNDGNDTKIVYVRFFYSNGKSVDKEQLIAYHPASPSAPTPTPAPTISPAVNSQSCLDVCYSTDLRTNVGKDASGTCNASVSSTSHLCATTIVGSKMRCNGAEYQCVDRGTSGGGLFWTGTGN